MRQISPKALISPSAKFDADELIIDDFAVIEDDVWIDAVKVRIGYGAKVERGVKIKSTRNKADEVIIGDCSLIGFNVRILAPVFRMGDYCALHNHSLVLGYKPCVMGHNNWIGEYTILNSTESLTLGNNIGIGTGSRIWTHVSHGELLEGCTMFGAWPVTVEDDVWIVGGAVISPNLILRRGSVVMTGAVLTKSTEPKHIYAGVPAKDVTDKLNVYQNVTLDDKERLMRKFVDEFLQQNPRYNGMIMFAENVESCPVQKNEESVVILKRGEVANLARLVSVFSLDTKRYTKKRTKLEEKFMRFMVNYRAKFIPIT